MGLVCLLFSLYDEETEAGDIRSLPRGHTVSKWWRTDDPGLTGLLPHADLGKSPGLIITAVIDLHQPETLVPPPAPIPVTPAMPLCRQLGSHLKPVVHSSGCGVCPLGQQLWSEHDYFPSRNSRACGFPFRDFFQTRLCWECMRDKLAYLLKAKLNTASESLPPWSYTPLGLHCWGREGWLCHLSHCGWLWEWGAKMKTVWSLSSSGSQIIVIHSGK